MRSNSVKKYNIFLRVLHWLMALIFFALLAGGVLMKYYVVGEQKLEMYAMHKAVGLTFLMLAIVRLALRIYSTLPSLPSSLTYWEKMLTHIVHNSLYVIMFAMPITGYTMSVASNKPVAWFFGVTVPSLLPVHKQVAFFANTAHHWIAFLALGMVSLHVLGFLKHLLYDRINILNRIF